MKFPIISTAVLSLCAFAATAQADVKVATVSVKSLYTLFHKRFETENVLQQQVAKIKDEVKTREDKLRALQEEDKKIREKYDSSLSESAVAKLREQHAAKTNEIKAADQELKDFVQRRGVAFKELRAREMRVLLEEVQTAITTVAEQSGVDVVLDSGSISAQADLGIGTATFPYVKKSFDITPEVLKVLNADAPAGFNPEEELKKQMNAAQQPAEAPATK